MIRWRWSEKVWPSGQAGLGPERLGQRLGGDHERVHGRQRPALARQGRGPGLEARTTTSAVTVPRAVRTSGAGRAPPASIPLGRLDGQHRRPLVEGHPSPLDRVGQPPGQPGRLERRAVRGVGGPEDARSPPAAGGPRPPSSQRRSSSIEPEARGPRPPPSGPGPPGPGCGRPPPCPPLAKWQSIPSAARRAAHLVDRLPAWPAAWPSAAAGPCSRARRASEAAKRAEHQPPLRPEAPKPATSRLQHGDPQGGVGHGQRVGRPQTGEAGAHHGHVDVEVAGRGRVGARSARRAGPTTATAAGRARGDLLGGRSGRLRSGATPPSARCAGSRP